MPLPEGHSPPHAVEPVPLIPSGLPIGDLLDRSVVTIDLERPASVLAIAAHPDDAEFGCGATLAKWAKAGTRLHVLVLTDGSKGTWDNNQDMSSLVETRQLEQQRAISILCGTDQLPASISPESSGPQLTAATPESTVRFMGWIDGELDSGPRQRRAVCEVIRQVRPAVVLGHDPWRRYRLHPDHRHAGWLTVDALVAARDPKFYPEMTAAPHRPRALLLWEPDEPNHVEDVSGFLGVKVRSLLAHSSQHRSTMGVTTTQLSDGATPDSDVDTHLHDREQFGQLAGKVARQFSMHGSIAALAEGEAFRLLADL